MTHCSLRRHFDEQIFDEKMGKMEEWSSTWVVERIVTTDLQAVAGVREANAGLGSMTLPHRVARVVCSSLELVQALPPNSLPMRTIALALSNGRMSKMESSLFSGLSLLERSLWSMLPTEAVLVSVGQQGGMLVSVVWAAT